MNLAYTCIPKCGVYKCYVYCIPIHYTSCSHKQQRCYLQADASALIQGQVLSSWDSLWEGPSAPLDYIRSAIRRASALEAWHSFNQKPGGLLANAGSSPQDAFDLGQLFRPGAFINALRQQAARTAGVPLGDLKLYSIWQGGRLPKGKDCPLAVHVCGVMLQGALFDGNSLSPAWQVGRGAEQIVIG